MSEMVLQGEAKDRGPRWHYALVGAMAAVIVLWQLGGTVMEDHECHLAITARTMADPNPQPWIVESEIPYEIPPATALNRWMVPVENGRPRLVKTPLPYWAAAGVARAAGGEVTNTTARLPSALCAILLSLVTLWTGRRLFPPRAALLGAIMLAACVGFQKWGRDARPEMMLCLLINVAMALFLLGLEATRRGGHVGWMAAFWVTMGLANLAKEFVPLLLAWPLLAFVLWRQSERALGDGPSLRLLRRFLLAGGVGLAVHLLITIVTTLSWWRRSGLPEISGKAYYLTMAVCLGAPMAWYFFRTRGWGAVGRLLPTALPGMVVMAALFVPWMWYMNHLFPGLASKVFSGQVTERASGTGLWAVDRRSYVYLQSLLTLTLPWLAFVPGAFAVALMERFREHRKGLVYLLLWSVGLIGLFTASAAKREHYILPMLPAFCLLMGFIAEDVFFRHAWISKGLARLLGVAHAVAAPLGVAVVAAIWYVSVERGPWATILAYVTPAAAVMAAGGLLAWKGRLRPFVGLLAAATAVIYLGHWGTIPYWDERRPIADFATEVAQRVRPGEPLFHWGDPQAKIVFYAGRTIPAVQWPFERKDPDAPSKTIGRRTLEWLQKDANRPPWIIGFSPNPERLSAAGYVPAFCKQDVQERQYLFTLYQWRPAPATAPATSEPASR